jgi:SOS-response transcriptional repressor LexA
MSQNMQRPPLTARQDEILRFIKSFLEEHWRTPTLREISAEFGFSSPNGAQSFIHALRRKGYLERGRKGCHGFGAIVGCTLRIEGFEEVRA